MFAIAVEQRQYQTYVLTNPMGPSSLEIVPERGGIVTRWQVGDHDLLYLDAERFADPSLSIRGGIPILFPICGNLPDNIYHHKGQALTLKQHGFARDLPWAVTGQETRDRVSLTLTLTSNEQTRAVYPFDFQLDFTYTLHGTRLAMHQRYTNRSADPMPFSVGFHPYFPVSDKDQLAFAIPATQIQDQRTQTVAPFSGHFDFNHDEIDVAFPHPTAQTATVTDPQRRLRLALTYSSQFSTLVFWTVKGKAFYCLEPWTAPRNALNTGHHLLVLEPGHSLETTVDLSVEML